MPVSQGVFLLCMRDISSFDVVFIDHDKRHYVPVSQGVSVSVYWVGVESKNKSSAADFVAIMLLLLRPFLLIN